MSNLGATSMKRGDHDLSIVHDIARRNLRHSEIVRDYLRGDPIAEIASRYDLCQGSIGKLRKLYDLPKRHPGRDPIARETALEMYRMKVPIKEITGKTGLDRKTLWSLVKRHNIPLRRHSDMVGDQERCEGYHGV